MFDSKQTLHVPTYLRMRHFFFQQEEAKRTESLIIKVILDGAAGLIFTLTNGSSTDICLKVERISCVHHVPFPAITVCIGLDMLDMFQLVPLRA